MHFWSSETKPRLRSFLKKFSSWHFLLIFNSEILNVIQKETDRCVEQQKRKRRDFRNKNISWPVERSECARNKNISCRYNMHLCSVQIICMEFMEDGASNLYQLCKLSFHVMREMWPCIECFICKTMKAMYPVID